MRVLTGDPPARGDAGAGPAGAVDLDLDLDLSGLKCPLPVLRTRRALRRLPAGGALVVTCTDPMAALDIPNLVREEGARLDAAERAGAVLRFRIVAAAGRPRGPSDGPA